MRESVSSAMVCAFGVVFIYLFYLLGTLFVDLQMSISAVWWLVLVVGVFILGFAASELARQESTSRQTALEAIGLIRLTSEEGQRLCDHISRLFPTHVNVDPLAKCVITEDTQFCLADVTEVVYRDYGGEGSTEYRTSTVCLLEDHRIAWPVFELCPTGNPLRVLARLLGLIWNVSGDCRKFASFYEVASASNEPLSRTLSLPVRQWLSNVSYWSRYPAWTLRANKDHVLLFRRGKKFDVQEFAGLLSNLLVIVDCLDTEKREPDALGPGQMSVLHESEQGTGCPRKMIWPPKPSPSPE